MRGTSKGGIMKSVTKNAGLNLVHRLLSVAFPLLTSIYISRTLGVEGVGTVASAQNLVSYFTFISSLGIPTYGVRTMASARDNRKKCNKAFTELFSINFLSTTLALIAYLVLVASLNYGKQLVIIHYTFASLIFLNYFNIEWLYQGFEEYKYITIRSLMVKLLAFFMMLIFVHGEEDILPYVFCICLGTAGNNILNMIRMNKYVHFEFKGLCFKRHLGAILTLFASTISVELYSLLDTTMLTYMTEVEYVGYYSNAVKIVKMAASVITAMSNVLLPRLSFYYQQHNRESISTTMKDFFDMITLLCIPGCVGLCLTANSLVEALFGNAFLPSAVTIRILSSLVIFMPLSALFSQIVLTVEKEKEYFISVTTGTIINVLLNAILIVPFFHNGAAVASVATELSILLVMFLAAQKIQKISYFSKEIAGVLFSTVIMGIAVTIVGKAMQTIPAIFSLFGQILAGCIVYFVMLILVHNKQLHRFVKKVSTQSP